MITRLPSGRQGLDDDDTTASENLRPSRPSRRSEASDEVTTLDEGGPDLDALRPGTVLDGRYQIVRTIGEGGMARVVLARQLGLGRDVAIKVIHPDLARDPGLKARFRREAQILKGLCHPNTVRLYDLVEASRDRCYLVTEYLTGLPLDSLLRRDGGMSHHSVIRMGIQVLGSLIEAHSRGIIHRDLKPGNVFLCEVPGTVDFVKVLDFGIASAGALTAPGKTSPNALFGTPPYMAPEVLRGGGWSERSDLYALGLLLAELVTGKPAIPGESAVQVAVYQQSRRALGLPPALEHTPLGEVIRRAVEWEPEARYGSAEEMRKALEDAATRTANLGALDGDGASRGPVTELESWSREALSVKANRRLVRMQVWARRHRAVVVVCGLILAAGVAVLVASSDPTAPASGARPESASGESTAGPGASPRSSAVVDPYPEISTEHSVASTDLRSGSALATAPEPTEAADLEDSQVATALVAVRESTRAAIDVASARASDAREAAPDRPEPHRSRRSSPDAPTIEREEPTPPAEEPTPPAEEPSDDWLHRAPTNF